MIFLGKFDKLLRAVCFFFLSVLLVGCASNGSVPATVEPLDENPLKTDVPVAVGGRCGDGVCDEIEKGDPNLCPQDCKEEKILQGDTTNGSPACEPPINVFLVLHIDELGELGKESFKPDTGMYQRTKKEIDWLMEEAVRHDLHFTSLYNGWFTKWALDSGDLSQFETLLSSGHEIGSEAHKITYDPASDSWIYHYAEISTFGRPNYDPDLARQCWEDSSKLVNSVLERIGYKGQNKVMCSTAISLPDERNLMNEFCFQVAAGNRLEAGVNYLGHMPWNPWRASNSDEPGYEVAEDLSSPYISLNHAAQVGGSESHDVAATLPQLKRQFIQLYVEWLSRERTGADDRVWSFGFVTHPNHGDSYNQDLAVFLDWLDTYFIGHLSPYGNTIARYATVSSIAEEFFAWENEHIGISSFNYVDGDPYPYTFSIFAEKLAGADYERHVDLGQEVSCIKLVKDGNPVFLLWSNQGEFEADMSIELSGQVSVIDGSGHESHQDASCIKVTEEPVLVEEKS